MAKKKKSVLFHKNFNTVVILAAALFGLVLGLLLILQPKGSQNINTDAAVGDVTIEGYVMNRDPDKTKNYTVTLTKAVNRIDAIVKEGHPESGCNSQPNPGNSSCDQNQIDESFDLYCNNNLVLSYRDLGAEIEDYNNVQNVVSMAPGTYNCQVRHLLGTHDIGSVDYKITFVASTATPTPTPPATALRCNYRIPFEYYNGGNPKEGYQVYGWFTARFTVSKPTWVGTDSTACSNGYPKIAVKANPQTAIYQDSWNEDVLSSRILTDDGLVNRYACNMNIDYSEGHRMNALDFRIVGIDNDSTDPNRRESYDVVAKNASGNVLTTFQVPPPGKLGAGGTKSNLVQVSAKEPIARVEIRPRQRSVSDVWGWGIDQVCIHR